MQFDSLFALLRRGFQRISQHQYLFIFDRFGRRACLIGTQPGLDPNRRVIHGIFDRAFISDIPFITLKITRSVVDVAS